MQTFTDFVGKSVPWLVGFAIALAIFLFCWFILGEIYGPRIRREVRRRAKRIKKIRKSRKQSKRKNKKKRSREKLKKIRERLRRMKESAELRKKEGEESLLTRVVKSGIRKIHYPDKG